MAVQTTDRGVEFVRTPEERFAAVAGFDLVPKYAAVEGLRMAYLDEGTGESGHTLLLPHGEPTWGYLFRFMIPPFVAAGHRGIVPDLIGFGRSDKPTARSTYTYASHVRWMKTFLDGLSLRTSRCSPKTGAG